MMKVVFLFHVLAIAALYSCREPKVTITDLLPGSYGRFARHEFGHEYDTIVISKGERPGTFLITRRWKYERVKEGSSAEPEYHKATTTAIYSKAAGGLQDMENGDVYLFISDALFTGTTKYKKL